ncbi:hypothetical protein BDQ17DRAFT_1351187 [Cyathus striatus]|nr:hypothetical protein BDQ17DRAFT_1351187 [Cyathus striatus]
MESLYKDRLHTNYAPTDGEAREIQASLSAPARKISNLDEQILRMKQVLDKLSLEREQLDNDVNAHRALLAPARRLPHDILREIFIRCLPEGRNATMSVTEAPILLGRVCSLWRSIAYTTPRLWSTIHIPVAVPNNLDDVDMFDRPRLEALEEWLTRSGACPLNISLSCRPTRPECVQRLLEILISFSDRWRNVRFVIPNSCLQLLANLTDQDVPRLHTTVIEISRHENWHASQEPLYSPSNSSISPTDLKMLDAPSVRNISLLDFGPQMLRLTSRRWQELTHLTVEFSTWRGLLGISMDDVPHLFEKCSNLRSCHLQLSGTLTERITRITVPLLTKLCITEGFDADATGLFKCLEFPSLRHISFRKQNFPPSPPTPPLMGQIPLENISPKVSLITLLSRATARVETLRINSSSLSFEDTVECLRLTPHLTRLSFDIPDDFFWTKQSWTNLPYYPHSPPLDGHRAVLSDALLQNLMPGPGKSELCPQLETFECGSGRGFFTEQGVLDFIRARAAKSSNKMRRVSVWFSVEKKLDIAAELSSIICAGLDVDLHYPPSYKLPPRKPYTPWDGIPVSLIPRPASAMPPLIGGWDY